MIKYAVGRQFLSSHVGIFANSGKIYVKKSNQQIADLLIKSSNIFIFDEEQDAMDFVKYCKEIIPLDEDYGHAYGADFIAPVFEISGEFKLESQRSFINKNKESKKYYESKYNETIHIMRAKFPENRAGRQDIHFEWTAQEPEFNTHSSCAIL